MKYCLCQAFRYLLAFGIISRMTSGYRILPALNRRRGVVSRRAKGCGRASNLTWRGKAPRPAQRFRKRSIRPPRPHAKANAQRAMAMSWAFEGNCKKAAEYEES